MFHAMSFSMSFYSHTKKNLQHPLSVIRVPTLTMQVLSYFQLIRCLILKSRSDDALEPAKNSIQNSSDVVGTGNNNPYPSTNPPRPIEQVIH